MDQAMEHELPIMLKAESSSPIQNQRRIAISFALILLLSLIGHLGSSFPYTIERMFVINALFDETFEYEINLAPPSDRVPKILTWTHFHFHDMARPLNAKQCPFKCEYGNRIRMDESEADAILFHVRDMEINPRQLPVNRRDEQLYIAYFNGPPHLVGKAVYGDNPIPDGWFNVTMGYRRNPETYWWSYGTMKKAETEEEMKRLEPLDDKKFDEILSKKTGLGFVMESNCHFAPSLRHQVLLELSDMVNTTLVGPCFRKHRNYYACPKSDFLDCENYLLDSHYFYFAFENSVCVDYVTEKFWRISKNIVPVVLRREIYKGYAPDSAFIAVDDFENLEELAEHLTKVAADPILYRSYFKWREDHYLFDRSWGVCELCRDLHYGNVTKIENFSVQEYYSLDQCEFGAGLKMINQTGKYFRGFMKQFRAEL